MQLLAGSKLLEVDQSVKDGAAGREVKPREAPLQLLRET